MKKIKYLIVGSGITGLSFALKTDDYLLIEKENKAGGLCTEYEHAVYSPKCPAPA